MRRWKLNWLPVPDDSLGQGVWKLETIEGRFPIPGFVGNAEGYRALIPQIVDRLVPAGYIEALGQPGFAGELRFSIDLENSYVEWCFDFYFFQHASL